MSEKVASKEVSDEGVLFKFSDDTVLETKLSDLSPEMVTQLALHGLSQKVGDSYSGVKGDVDEAKKLATGTWERLVKGEFKATRESSGGGSKVTDLARALAKVAGVELVDAVGKLAEMDRDQKKGLRENLHIQRALLEIQKEKAAEKEAKLAKELDEADGQELADLFG